MPPVRRHRIGDQMPAVIHPDPDLVAITFCRDLVTETDAECVILFGSRALGGWDEQSDLDVIVIHQAAFEGLVFCMESERAQRYRHDGDVSNEWELLTLEHLQEAVVDNRARSPAST